MSPALSLLLRLRLFSLFRRWGRTLKTGKGILLTLLGLAVFAPWLLTLAFAPRHGMPDFGVEPARRFGPLILLAYALLTLLFSSGDRLLYYTPAEVAFLFTGPFRQRELLSYKLASVWFNTAFSSAIFTFAMPFYRKSWIAGFVGFYLAMMFFQLLWIIASLVASTAGALARTRFRRGLLVVGAGLVVAGLTPVAQEWSGLGPRELLDRVESSPVIRIAAYPFRPFVYAFTSETKPDLLFWGSVCAAAVAVETLIVYLLNASYLEALAASSAKTYERVLQIRRGGSLTAAKASERKKKRGRARGGLGDFPYWGGVGPALWRQLLGASRDPTRLFLAMSIVLIPLVMIIAGKGGPAGVGRGLIFGAEGMILWMTLFLTPVIPFDFRGDIDRMESLKTLPIPSWALGVGQVLTPALLLAVPQFVALLVASVWLGLADLETTLALFLIFPALFQIIALENLIFLLYPTRIVATNPGDFTVVGRQILVMFFKVIVVGGSLGICVGFGALTAWLFPNGLAPAILVSLAGLMIFSVGTVPFLAWAYDRYDVARDTPA